MFCHDVKKKFAKVNNTNSFMGDQLNHTGVPAKPIPSNFILSTDLELYLENY